MRGREKAKKFSIILNIVIFLLKLLPKKLLIYFLSLVRHLPGYLGLALRYSLFKVLCKSCGENVLIAPGSYFFNLHNLSIGDNVSIHPLCYIDAAGEIKIGNDVSIAHNCSLISFEHDYNTNSIIKDNPVLLRPIVIGSNVWLGAGVRVLSGSSIGNRVVIGAGTVVKDRVVDNSLNVGVPVKKIRNI